MAKRIIRIQNPDTGDIYRAPAGTPVPDGYRILPTETDTPASAPIDHRELLSQGIMRSGFGMVPYQFDQGSRMAAAGVARFGPGLAANPAIAGPLSAAGEALAQRIEGSPSDPVAIGIAGAAPPIVSGVVRLGRGLGRTTTRMAPTLFRKAHEKAGAAAGETAEQMRPAVSPAVLFGQAGDLGGEPIATNSLRKMLSELDATLPEKPVNEGLKRVRQHMDNTLAIIGESPAVRLDELMKLRLDLGRSVAERGAAPELKGIYRGIMEDLEAAVRAGGPGAAVTRQALDAFKRDLGVAHFRELVEQATSRRAIAGADTAILNVPKLSDLIAKNSAELTRLLGSDSREIIGAFVTRFRALPPEHAANAANILLSSMFGAAGLITGGVTGLGPLGMGLTAGGAAVAQELGRNMFAVGRNLPEINRLMNFLVTASRSVIPPQE